MTERILYEPRELRDAALYVKQQTELLRGSHAANWRKKFIGFVDEMTLRFEALRLLTTLLGGNRNVDVGGWFTAAAAGEPPPLPPAPYDAMALVWQQVSAAVKRQGEGFFVTNAAVDLPYVLSSGFPGESLGEKFWAWSQRCLVPFTEHLEAWLDRIVARLPASGTVDLWDLAIEVVNQGGAVTPTATADEGGEAARAAGPAKSAAKRAKKAKPAKGTKKGPPVTSAKLARKKAPPAKKG